MAKGKTGFRRKKIIGDGKNCIVCSRPLSMYNKNAYGLCHSCLSKAQRQSDPCMPVVVVQQIAQDIHESSAKDALGPLQ